jgi:hypothetical protein
MDSLRIAVLAAATWAVSVLLVQWFRVRAYGRRGLFSAPAGDPAAGVRYAFTKAMLPGAKESVREHLPSYLAGMGYHLGLFTALALLVADLVGLPSPFPFQRLCQVCLAAGTVGGLSLLLKRIFQAELRGLSGPDDYLSNLLVTVFMVLALTGPSMIWLVSAMVLFAYAPLGKIRHCLFFFTTRAAFGAFFGRRGVFPPGGARV